MPGLVYRFGPFELGVDRGRLCRGETELHVSRPAVNVLALLAAQAGHIVGREALISGAWQGMAVTTNSLPKRYPLARLAGQPVKTPATEYSSPGNYVVRTRARA